MGLVHSYGKKSFGLTPLTRGTSESKMVPLSRKRVFPLTQILILSTIIVESDGETRGLGIQKKVFCETKWSISRRRWVKEPP